MVGITATLARFGVDALPFARTRIDQLDGSRQVGSLDGHRDHRATRADGQLARRPARAAESARPACNRCTRGSVIRCGPARFHSNATVDRSSLTTNSARSQSGRSAITEYATPSRVTVTSSSRACSQPLSLRISARTYPSAPRARVVQLRLLAAESVPEAAGLVVVEDDPCGGRGAGIGRQQSRFRSARTA